MGCRRSKRLSGVGVVKVGDMVRDTRCGTLCVIKSIESASDVIVWSFSGCEEVLISADNLEKVNESR